MKNLFGLAVFLIAATVLTTGVILYAKGYRPNFKERSLNPTGIVSIKSQPSGADVFVNSEKKGTTNLDISDLSPGKYKIQVSKEGFSAWEKEISVKKEAVNLVEVVLFPKAPSLQALTSTGVANPLVSPAADKIVFALTSPKGKAGIWALSLSTNTLPLFFSKDLTKLVSDTSELAFSSATYEFSPDGKQLLVNLASQHMFFLLDSSKSNDNPKEVTLDLDKIKADWNKKTSSDTKAELKSISPEAQKVAAALTNLVFSPDKTKFFGRQSDGSSLLFDTKPELVNNQSGRSITLPKADRYLWYSDNHHIILVNPNVISIMEVDGTNNLPIYTGSFDHSFVTAWPDGSKIVIAANFNTQSSNLPNLYAIELR